MPELTFAETVILVISIATLFLMILSWVNRLEDYSKSDEFNEHKDDKEYWETKYPWP